MQGYLIKVSTAVLVLGLLVAAGIHVVNARSYVPDYSENITVLQVIR